LNPVIPRALPGGNNAAKEIMTEQGLRAQSTELDLRGALARKTIAAANSDLADIEVEKTRLYLEFIKSQAPVKE